MMHARPAKGLRSFDLEIDGRDVARVRFDANNPADVPKLVQLVCDAINQAEHWLGPDVRAAALRPDQEPR